MNWKVLINCLGIVLVASQMSLAQIAESAKLVASDAGAGDRLGREIVVSGDTIFTGARFHDCAAGGDCGTIYVFVEPAGGWSGTLTETARLFPSVVGAGDRFGVSVGADGDVVVAGSRESCSTGPLCGAAYIFEKPAGGWSGTVSHSARLISSDLAPFDNFALTAMISADTVVLGAQGSNCPGGGNACGAAYVFVRPAGGWVGTITESAKLVPSDVVDGDAFGDEVAVEGDTVVIGSSRDECVAGSDCGSAYVFVKPVGGWSGIIPETAKLVASDAAQGDRFGVGVSLSADQILVGAYHADCGSGIDCGAMYVYDRPAGGWSGVITESAKLVTSDAVQLDRLGESVSISGNKAAGTAELVDCAGGPDCGAVYVFTWPMGGWSGTVLETAKLVASDAAPGDNSGPEVSVFGSTVAMGSIEKDCAAGADCGAAYVFELGCPDLSTIDYRGFTAGACAVPQNAVSVFSQSELDAYMTDFGFDGVKVKNLKVNFNPIGEAIIVSPCEVHLNGSNNYLDIDAKKLCVYGRKGITVANDAGNPDRGVTAGSVALISEEGDAGFSKGLELIAQEILIQAAGEAKIGLDNVVEVERTVALISTGDSPSSNAIIRQNSEVSAQNVLLMASRGAAIGESVVLDVSGGIVIESTGTAVKSVAEIGPSAQVSAGGVSQTSGNKSKVGQNASVTVIGGYHLSADGTCSIASSASINAGSVTGNCLP